jgi:hypothetical protein
MFPIVPALLAKVGQLILSLFVREVTDEAAKKLASEVLAKVEKDKPG